MEVGRLFEKTRSWSRLFFLIPFTLILLVMAVVLSPVMTKGYLETEGTVTKVEKEITYDADNTKRETYETTFTYTVDGVDYEQSFSLNGPKEIGSKITVYYNPDKPANVSSSLNNSWLWIIFLVLGIAAAVYTVYAAIRDSRRNKQTDQLRAQRDRVAEQIDAGTYESVDESELTEYYFRFDGHSFKPGYLIEDKTRMPIFEGKMLRNNPFVPKEYEFVNHRTNRRTVHKVSHTVTSGSGDSEFSNRSRFKFDDVNIWDYLHNNGVLIETGMGGMLKAVYKMTQNGRFLARAEMTGRYVHEEDAEGKAMNIPNRMFYRIWTDSEDLEMIFTALFAIAETEQIVYS